MKIYREKKEKLTDYLLKQSGNMPVELGLGPNIIGVTFLMVIIVGMKLIQEI